MNKQEFIASVSLNGNMSKKDATVAIEAVFEVITETLAKNESVQLVNFGTFSVKDRAERTGRNPSNGEPMQILAKQVPAFKSGKGLKSSVKGLE